MLVQIEQLEVFSHELSQTGTLLLTGTRRYIFKCVEMCISDSLCARTSPKGEYGFWPLSKLRYNWIQSHSLTPWNILVIICQICVIDYVTEIQGISSLVFPVSGLLIRWNVFIYLHFGRFLSVCPFISQSWLYIIGPY